MWNHKQFNSTMICQKRRRRRCCAPSATFVCFIFITNLWASIEAFSYSSGIVRQQKLNRLSGGWKKTRRNWRRSVLDAVNGNNKKDVTWSKEADSSSPFKVRKRVKAVLEKARTRTGIENSSTSVSSIVADAATLGGLGDGSNDFVLQLKDSEDGTNPSSGASSSSSSFPDEDLLWQRNGSSNGTEHGSAAFDAINADVPAAAKFTEPLPFTLPILTEEQKQSLRRGERLQEQARMGREGSGYVVVDVKAPPYVVWECLLDFETYPETIPTVRDMQLFTSKKLDIGYVNEKPVSPGTGRETRHYGIPSITRASFTLSKFRLKIAAIHEYTPHPKGHYMMFTLDKSCTNMVMKGAKGIWFTEEDPEGREGYTRVYLLCEVQISRALPSFIVDYAADRAMPRATTWLKPQVETAADLWLKPAGAQ